MERKRILILGGGYGGLACLRGLSGRLDPAKYELLLMDADPYHTIKTRFHERAVLESRDFLLRFPLDTLARASGAVFVQDEASEINFAARVVRGRSGDHPYHRLVIALGGQTAYFGVPGAAEHTVSLQTYSGAQECSRRFKALRIGEPGVPRRRVVVCGAGIEGLEVAAMVRQIAPPDVCDLSVVERSDALMARSQCRDAERRYMASHLQQHDIRLLLGKTVKSIAEDQVHLASGEALPADLVYWCSGVRRVELGGIPPGEPFVVNLYLQSVEHPDVFAIGDFAKVDSRDEVANLGSAQRAVYHGGVVAENLWRHETLRPMRPVRYRPEGELIALGDLDGVGVLFGLSVRGLAASGIKKANELRYLRWVYGDVPRSALRGLWKLASGG